MRIIKNHNRNKSLMALAMIWTMSFLPLIVPAQTRVNMPKNKYKVQDDVRVGREAAAQVARQFPLLNDGPADQYIDRIGSRLVAAIPSQFQQPAFDYRFEVVNARDINAFALPGGPMYVNRGMIEAARNEGEIAGVMAHEISHIALRHATAQQTKVSNPLNQILGIGAILGGAVLGGQTGAQLGQIFAQGYFTRYSRDYETQADVLGSQIMAEAGYDPRDLANMFRTIEQQSGGGRGPEFLSSHPNPGNRYENINREADLLRVTSNTIKITPEFRRVQERLNSLPRARSMAEIARDYRGGQGQEQSPTYGGGRYSSRVALPSARTRVYTDGSSIRLSVPDNWREFAGQGTLTFAPEGAYGDQGITHGAMIGIHRSNSGNALQASENYVNGILQSNPYLRQQSRFSNASVAGRQGYAIVLTGRSPVTGRNEVVAVFTAPMQNGSLLYINAVAPEEESYRYNPAFRNIINSIRING
ncbi:MAG: M48 family metalloprotease [Blastocatellia bacterium]|nr:M48 family metalloprotease [Blastocatellia bacterium]